MRLWDVFLLVVVLSLAGCLDKESPSAQNEQADTVSEAPHQPLKLNRELSHSLRLIEGHQTGEARAALALYRNRHPDDGPAEFLTGLSYHREKRYGRARPHFERSIELSPGYHPTYHFLGWCLYYLGETDKSARAFEVHLTYLPTEGDSHFALGLIALDRDQLQEAETRFLRSIELQQNRTGRAAEVSKAHARLADISIRRGQLVEARDHLERATTLWPEHYTAFYKLSRVLTRLGEMDKAQEAFGLYRDGQDRARPARGVPEPAS